MIIDIAVQSRIHVVNGGFYVVRHLETKYSKSVLWQPSWLGTFEGMDSITFSDQREKECTFQNRHTLAAYNATQSVF